MKIAWEYGLSTHVGPIKKVNEDRSFFRFSNQSKVNNYAIALMADGMGGYQAGDRASEFAVSKIKQWWDHRSIQIEYGELTLTESIESLKTVFFEINDELIKISHQDGIIAGTTLSVILFHQNQYVICHVGDSRIYQLSQKMISPIRKMSDYAYAITEPLSEGSNPTHPLTDEMRNIYPVNTSSLKGLTQLTVDHSWVEAEIRNSRLTREEARVHPRRNVLLQCLGIEPALEVFVNSGYSNGEDLFLLCSDGFHSLFSDSIIEELLLSRTSQNVKLQSISDELVELANQHKDAVDNISVMLLQRKKLERNALMKFFSNLI
ncbi:PP2C family protein-serine/threonine phosphatase [Robertmurraya massiliosenegalensis]|uniref:PP2C family protein-serine/threonine phosphatase n=1 Tax=Robertmurraya massiliosenegalensis TaxID=1287657 RepID=UPI00031E3A6A|nr:protein phosphatase 2C domain-containing protein [Robertmurraya massiliosenegalensis]